MSAWIHHSFRPGVIGCLSLLLAACSGAPAAQPTAVAPTSPPKPAVVASPGAAGSPGAVAASSPAASPQAAAAPTRPDPALAAVWQGKTVTMSVGQPPGGGHDTWARLVARHLGKHLPGAPTVIVQNVPGAVSVVATNQIFQSAGDGLNIGEVSPDIPTFQLQAGDEREAIRYDATKLNWLGSAGSTTYVLLVHSRTGIRSGADLATKSVRMGDQSPGGVGHRINLMLREGLGWQTGRPAFGYTGTREIVLGIDRGEVDGVFLPWDSALQQKGDDIRSGAMIPLVMVGPALKDPLLANVPAARDLMATRDADMRQILALTERPLEWFRPFIVSPNTPPNILAGMRAALTMTMSDPELLRDAEQLKFEIDHIPGERLQQMIGEYMQTPKVLVERVETMVKSETPS
ncbi:MAG: Bug family tripartite tricarboxylate transporter substrate binding protein [Chloroflexota bacterium]